MKKQIVLNHINDSEKDLCLIYIDKILKDIIWHKSGFSFKLPSANTDWSMDILKLCLHLCKEYRNRYFINGYGSGNENAGFIAIYVYGD